MKCPRSYSRQITLLIALVLMAAGLTGCVAQSEADRWQSLYRKTQAQVEDLRARLDEANARVKALQERKPETDAESLAKLEQCLAERDRLAQALAQAEDKIRSLGATGALLPPELDQALLQLAQSNPELMSYDPERGMLKFHSDLTFALGSTDVKAAAAGSLAKLAAIINAPIAQKYDVKIVGHTDNVPIVRVKATHPTNWHLSVHRAIAVKDVLEKSGVPGTRMEVAGYGEYRPVAANRVANGKAAGNEANRRVEIFLVPSTFVPLGAGAQAAPAAAPAAEPPAEDKPIGPAPVGNGAGDEMFK